MYINERIFFFFFFFSVTNLSITKQTKNYFVKHLFLVWVQNFETKCVKKKNRLVRFTVQSSPVIPYDPFFFFFACHPGGRSGRRTVPLPNNVNDVKICKKRKKCVGVPPTPHPPPPPPPRGGPRRGSEATERGEGVGGGIPLPR